MELLTTFGINWKLLIAQIINFLVLLYILRRFAYQPILKLLSERQKKIEQGIADSAEARKKLIELEQKEKAVLQKARAEGQKIISQAQKLANKNKEEIVSQSKNQATKIIQEAKEKITEEKNKMLVEIKKEVAELVIAATEKILNEKIDSKKDRELIEKVIK